MSATINEMRVEKRALQGQLNSSDTAEMSVRRRRTPMNIREEIHIMTPIQRGIQDDAKQVSRVKFSMGIIVRMQVIPYIPNESLSILIHL